MDDTEEEDEDEAVDDTIEDTTVRGLTMSLVLQGTCLANKCGRFVKLNIILLWLVCVVQMIKVMSFKRSII